MNTLPEIPWLVEGRKYIGMEENRDINTLNQFWRDVKRSGYKDQPNIPWCGAFVGSMLVRSGIDIKDERTFVPENSQYWKDFGVGLPEPEYGCIAVFKWKNGTGHVGFVVGKTLTGSLVILGGNQNDRVNEKAFLTNNLIALRWPEGASHIPEGHLPLIDVTTGSVNTR